MKAKEVKPMVAKSAMTAKKSMKIKEDNQVRQIASGKWASGSLPISVAPSRKVCSGSISSCRV